MNPETLTCIVAVRREVVVQWLAAVKNHDLVALLQEAATGGSSISYDPDHATEQLQASASVITTKRVVRAVLETWQGFNPAWDNYRLALEAIDPWPVADDFPICWPEFLGTYEEVEAMLTP